MVDDDRNASVGYLLSTVEQESKKLFRTLEKLYRKYINAKFGVLFNQTCLNENLLPNYTYININSHIHRY